MLGTNLSIPATALTRKQSVPALPPGFAYLNNPDGSYAVSSNGAYVVRYTG